MERTEVIEMMGELKLYGMKSAYDEIYATALKRQHEPQRLVGDLLKAEISEKHARSIRYQLAIAKLPLAKDVDDFPFKSTPINENLVRDLASGECIAQQRNVVLVGGTGRARRIWRSPSREAASAPVHAAGSSTPSISSIASKPKADPADRVGLPTISPASTSSSSTNWAICLSRNRAASCCST